MTNHVKKLFNVPAVCKRTSGFTLVEILVATTILLVIVILVSMVFQQSNAAFEGGQKKVRAQTVMRNIIGVISRDLARAVDSDDYPGIDNIIDGGSTMEFLALTGTPSEDVNTSEIQYIVYDFGPSSVKREVYDVSYDGSTWSIFSKPAGTVEFSADGKDSLSAEYSVDQDNNSSLPYSVTIRTEVEAEGLSSPLILRSYGPNGSADTAAGKKKDDIVVGGVKRQ